MLVLNEMVLVIVIDVLPDPITSTRTVLRMELAHEFWLVFCSRDSQGVGSGKLGESSYVFSRARNDDDYSESTVAVAAPGWDVSG